MSFHCAQRDLCTRNDEYLFLSAFEANTLLRPKCEQICKAGFDKELALTKSPWSRFVLYVLSNHTKLHCELVIFEKEQGWNSSLIILLKMIAAQLTSLDDSCNADMKKIVWWNQFSMFLQLCVDLKIGIQSQDLEHFYFLKLLSRSQIMQIYQPSIHHHRYDG